MKRETVVEWTFKIERSGYSAILRRVKNRRVDVRDDRVRDTTSVVYAKLPFVKLVIVRQKP